MRKASIIVIGSEILRGLVQDTNSWWLAGKLTEMGFSVIRIIAVPDDEGEIAWALKSSLEVADVVVVTGGLGFTKDDITLSAAAKALGLRLVLSEDAVEMLKRKVKGEEVQYYIKAAHIPEGGKPLYNQVGISPGVYLEINGKDLFFLPGVPAEMTKMFEDRVKPLLEGRSRGYMARITITTDYTKESEVDSLVAQLREKHSDVYFKTHATVPVVLSVLVSSSSQKDLQVKLDRIIEELKKVIKIRDIKAE
ncbi:MAG: competence/damage-inducible protein A [Desulfurococcaceae archaeon]